MGVYRIINKKIHNMARLSNLWRKIKVYGLWSIVYGLLCLSVIYAADETGGLQMPYILEGLGGPPTGMGGAYTAIADDGNAPLYNPAGLADINKKIFTLNYENSFIGNANFIYISYVGKMVENKQGIGVSFLWNGVGSMSSYTPEQLRSGIYSFSQFQIGVSYGMNLFKNFHAGITGKIFYHNIETYSANTFDADIGIMFTPFKNFKTGLLFQNLLPVEHTLYSEPETVPFNIKLGMAYNITKINLLLSYEIEKQIEPSFSILSFYHHFGIRYNLLKVFNITAGYNIKNITFGLHLILHRFSFFTGTSQNALGGKLNLSASYEIKEQASSSQEMEYFYEGVAAYQNKDYRTAIRYFENVLKLRDNPIAQYYLDNSKAYLESEKWMSEEDKALVGMKFELARKYIAQGYYGKAIKNLREILDLNPGNDEANTLMTKIKAQVQKDVENYYNKAMALFKVNKYEESLKECDNALELNPEHEPTLELKSKNNEILKDVLMAERKEEEKKAEAEALYQQGLVNYQNENWVEAINNFKKSYELVENPEVKSYLEKSEKKLKEAEITEKHKKESDTHFKLGLNFYNKGKLKEAIDEFEKAVNLYPQNREAERYLNEARAKYESIIQGPLEAGKKALREGSLAEAIENFEKVLKIDSKNEVAKQFLAKARSLVKDYVNSNLKIAEQAYKKEDYSKSLKYYREVLKLDPNNKEAKKGADKSREKIEKRLKAHYQKGVELFNQDKLKEAINEFKEALSMDSEYIPAQQFLEKAQKKYKENEVKYTIREYIQNGIDFFQNKNYSRAKEYFEKVLEIEPDNSQAKEYIKKCDKELANLATQEKIAKIIADGMIAYRRKKFTEAIETWQKVKEIDPANKLIDEYIEYARRAQNESLNKYYNDGVKYFREDDLLSAKESLEKALQADADHKEAKKKLAEVKAAILQKVYSAKNSGKKEFASGNYQKATEHFEEILKYEKENDEIEDYLRMSQEAEEATKAGRELLKEHKYAEAMEKFNLVLDLNKEDKNAQNYINRVLAEGKKQASEWFNQGISYYQNGNLKSAYIRFLSVVKIEPGHQEAKKMLDKVSSEIDKKSAELYKSGLSYYESKDYRSAINEFKKLLELKNNYKDTRLYLTKAEKNYAKLTAKERKVSEEKIQQYLYDGIKLYRDGKFAEAIGEWEKVLKMDPNNSKALKYINRAKYKLKQLEKLK